MKKWLIITLSFVFVLTFLVNTSIKPSSVYAQAKGRWVFSEKTLIDNPIKKPPFTTEIAGEEGKKVLTAKFENQGIKEIAVIEMGWTVPPKELIPGENFEMVQTGLIKEWKTTHFFSSNMMSKIQRFGASCCEIAGSDLGFIRMDYESGDPIGVLKEVKKSGKIPTLGEMGSQDTKKIQILLKIQQNGADFQWIYIYEWKEYEESKNIEISLKIGSTTARVNGILKALDAPPFIESGRTFVPFRFLGESFGAKVSFTTNPSSKLVDTVEYALDKLTIVLYMGKKEALINQKRVILDTPPILKNNRVMVPVRFVSENLSARVDWNPLQQTIIISKD
jgi:hypothetical protein